MDFIGTKRKMETWTGANENVFVVPDNARCLFPLRQPRRTQTGRDNGRDFAAALIHFL